jgi:hypothetical protein
MDVNIEKWNLLFTFFACTSDGGDGGTTGDVSSSSVEVSSSIRFCFAGELPKAGHSELPTFAAAGLGP